MTPDNPIGVQGARPSTCGTFQEYLRTRRALPEDIRDPQPLDEEQTSLWLRRKAQEQLPFCLDFSFLPFSHKALPPIITFTPVDAMSDGEGVAFRGMFHWFPRNHTTPQNILAAYGAYTGIEIPKGPIQSHLQFPGYYGFPNRWLPGEDLGYGGRLTYNPFGGGDGPDLPDGAEEKLDRMASKLFELAKSRSGHVCDLMTQLIEASHRGVWMAATLMEDYATALVEAFQIPISFEYDLDGLEGEYAEEAGFEWWEDGEEGEGWYDEDGNILVWGFYAKKFLHTSWWRGLCTPRNPLGLPRTDPFGSPPSSIL